MAKPDRTVVANLYANNLIMDDDEIDINLAEGFFKKHDCVFSLFINGKYEKDDGDDKDTADYSNKNYKVVFFDLEDKKSFTEPVNILRNLDDITISGILDKIAVTVEKNSNYFAQIEYAVRGINPKDVLHFDIPSIAANFRYYANFCVKPKEDCYALKENALIYLSDAMPLAFLGWFIAPAFASKCIVDIVCTPNVTAAATLFAEICHEAGVPVQNINIIPRPKNDKKFALKRDYFKCRDSFGYQSESIESKQYRGAMIVGESADIDSAVDGIFEAAWSHNGMLPWSLKLLLVQESILEKFKSKLSLKLKMYKLNRLSCGKHDDVTAKAVNDFVNGMAINNIEPLSLHESFVGELQQNYVKPIIFFDDAPLNDEELLLPIVFMQPFRTTKEVISMVNSKLIAAVSVWCDKVTIANEFLGVNANHVWFNCFGLFSSCSGIGWYKPRFSGSLLKKELTIESDADIVIEKVAKAQTLWKSKLPEQRARTFIAIAKKLSLNFDSYVKILINQYKINIERAKFSLQKTIEFLKFTATDSLVPSSSCTAVNKTLHLKIKEPVGLVCTSSSHLDSLHEFIISVANVTRYGNGVIYGTRSTLVIELTKELVELGIPVAVCNSIDGLDVKFNVVKFIWIIPPCRQPDDTGNEDIERLVNIVRDKEIMDRMFSNTKSVWSTIGETYAN